MTDRVRKRKKLAGDESPIASSSTSSTCNISESNLGNMTITELKTALERIGIKITSNLRDKFPDYEETEGYTSVSLSSLFSCCY